MLKNNYLIKLHVLHHLPTLYLKIAKRNFFFKFKKKKLNKIYFTSDVSQISQIPGKLMVSARNGINETKRAKRR
jgi:hypothetical protein